MEKISDASNVKSLPVPDTFHVLPWAGAGKYKVGEVLCETFWSPGKPQEACPRYVARRQLQRLEELGCTLCSGWEEEFMLLHRDTHEPLFKGCDMASHLLFIEHEEFYLDLQKMLEQTGVEIEGICNEYAPGQLEFATKPVKGIRGVDMAFNFKETVKEFSALKGFQAVFMAKPYLERTGNGLHYNFSLVNQDGVNVFSEPDSEDKLSNFARHFLGGLMSHARAVAALCCPTVNCYRRLHKPWAPGQITWSIDKRAALYRVKFSRSGPYIENRMPSAAANPYLVVAATLAAGLDGVSKKIEPPSEMKQSATQLPGSLQEALLALEEDTTLAEALGTEFVDWFVTIKRSIECEELKDCAPTETKPEALEKEREMYFKFI